MNCFGFSVVLCLVNVPNKNKLPLKYLEVQEGLGGEGGLDLADGCPFLPTVQSFLLIQS